MAQKTIKPMTPFDSMVTPPHLYTLKLLLPYTPFANQRTMGIYIKFMEWQYTMNHFYGFSHNQLKAQSLDSASPFGMLDDLKPYMAKEEMEMMEQMSSMMNMMEMVQGMQSPTGTSEMSSGNSAGFNPMDMMMGMLNPDQQDMFQTYSSMFDTDISQTPPAPPTTPTKSNIKGENNYEYESMDESSSNEEY